MAGSDLVDVTTQRAPVAQAERWTQKSCYACSSKKIRCDRKDTCSSCTRAGKVCIYPPLGPRKRKAKAAVMAGMTSRIASLEKSVAKVHEEEDVACSTDHNIPNHILTPALNAKAMPLSKAQGASGDDVLVQNGSSSQYFNEIILSRVIGEVRHINPIRLRIVDLIGHAGTEYCVGLDSSPARAAWSSGFVPIQPHGNTLDAYIRNSVRQSPSFQGCRCTALEYLCRQS